MASLSGPCRDSHTHRLRYALLASIPQYPAVDQVICHSYMQIFVPQVHLASPNLAAATAARRQEIVVLQAPHCVSSMFLHILTQQVT